MAALVVVSLVTAASPASAVAVDESGGAAAQQDIVSQVHFEGDSTWCYLVEQADEASLCAKARPAVSGQAQELGMYRGALEPIPGDTIATMDCGYAGDRTVQLRSLSFPVIGTFGVLFTDYTTRFTWSCRSVVGPAILGCAVVHLPAVGNVGGGATSELPGDDACSVQSAVASNGALPNLVTVNAYALGFDRNGIPGFHAFIAVDVLT